MTDQEKLYETLGELLYVVAKSDGVIQKEEKDALIQILRGHKWASEISRSFEYEESKQPSIDELYNKVIAVCHRIGPSPLYEEFIKSMELIAESSNGIDQRESAIINSFSSDLITRFQKDIGKLRG